MEYRLSSIVIGSMILSACTTSSPEMSLHWDVVETLPAQGDTAHLGLAGPMTGLVGDHLLIGGGANFPQAMPWDGGKKAYPRATYLYRRDGDHLALQQEFELDRSIAYSGNASVAGHLYVAGGEDESGAVADVRRYTWDDVSGLSYEVLTPLPVPLTNGGLVFDHKALYFVGGENASEVSAVIYKLDLQRSDAVWETLLTLPYPVTNAIVVGAGQGKIWVAGGRKRNIGARSDFYDTVLEIAIEERQVKQVASLPVPLAAGTGVYAQGRLIVIGGDDASTFHRVEDLIFRASAMDEGEGKDKFVAEKNALQRAHPGFPKSVWAFDIASGAWAQLADIAGQSPVTTTAVLWGEEIIVPSGEVRAGVRTDQILRGKMTNK